MIERWELLQAQGEDLGARQDHHKLTSDLREVIAWLDCVLPELDRLQQGRERPSIQDMESSIHKLKVQSLFYIVNTHVEKSMITIFFLCLEGDPEDFWKLQGSDD